MLRAMMILIVAATATGVWGAPIVRNLTATDQPCEIADGWCCDNPNGAIADLGCPPDVCMCTWGTGPCINGDVCMECSTPKPPGTMDGMCAPYTTAHCTGCLLPRAAPIEIEWSASTYNLTIISL